MLTPRKSAPGFLLRCLAPTLIAATLEAAACTVPASPCEDPDCSAGGAPPAVDAGDGGTPDAGADSGTPDAGGDAGTPDAAGDAAICEADTETDPANCGDCGNPCAPGQTCSSGACTCGAFAAVSFSADIQPIFARSCAAGMCHPSGAGALGLELGAEESHGSLVGVAAVQCRDGRMRVLPGQPSESYLIDKLTAVQLCSGLGMPPSGSLPAEDIEKIAAWICAGALDD